MNSEPRALRLNGWGYADTVYPLDDRPYAWPHLAARLGVSPRARWAAADPAAIAIRSSRLSAAQLRELTSIVGEDNLRTDSAARLACSQGKSYVDLVRLRLGQVTNPTDGVAYPRDETQIRSLLYWAGANDVAVVPFGGGTSVVGGVEPRGERPHVALSLARLDQMLSLDRRANLARLQAGMLGPQVEAALAAEGYTLGHFPQSFEFSTLGGWIATRSAGQASMRYGRIEDMVASMRMVTPAGVIETHLSPATATGPSLLQMLIGSEGSYGVIVDATLRVRPRAAVSDGRGLVFHDFDQGAEAVRAITQNEMPVSVLRLSDTEETAMNLALRTRHSGVRALTERFAQAWLRASGHTLIGGSVMIALVEGELGQVRRQVAALEAIARRHGAASLGGGPARSWSRERFRAPYLRDTLMDHGILVDTVETATPWGNLLALHGNVEQALREALGERSLVMAHISHAYPDGASLYFTFLAPIERGHELGQWERVKSAATERILGAGGTLSHHHGIGADHARWLGRQTGEAGLAALRGAKAALDPSGILNPGKLFQSEGV